MQSGANVQTSYHVYKTSLTPPPFIEVLVPSQDFYGLLTRLNLLLIVFFCSLMHLKVGRFHVWYALFT
jgi:hypothetical protein